MGSSLIPGFELTLAWMADAGDITFSLSSSTVSGGGITLLSSNSVTTLGGRNDPVNTEVLTITRAIVNPGLLSLGNAVSTSFPASIDLPRFEIQVTIVTFISPSGFQFGLE